MLASLVSPKPIVKLCLNTDVYALLNMDVNDYRRQRLQRLIDTRFDGDRAKFGEAAELTKGRVSQLLKVGQAFGERAAQTLIERLSLPDRWFDMGYSEVSGAAMGSNRIPVISEAACGSFMEIVDDFAAGAAHEYVETDLEVSPYTFALTLSGNSMTPEFNAGDKVIIDPDVKPHSGDFVAARDGRGGATFKKYRLRGADRDGREVFELIPLNDDFEAMRSDQQPLEIIGTMVEHRRYRRRL